MLEAAFASPNALVSADWLLAHLDDPEVRIVEVDVTPASYDAGHIASAVFWNIYADLKDETYRLVDSAALEAILSDSGITPHTRVVFYGYGPALGYWLLKLYRHENVSILNSSKQQWLQEGRPVTTESAKLKSTRYPLPSPNVEIRASQPMVAASVGASDCVILDVRSHAEFIGERFWPSGATAGAGRPGHIPGAIHTPLDDVFEADGSFAPLHVLRRIFPERTSYVREVVTYCTIGNRASVAWFVLSEMLGRSGVRVYDSSWAEWGHMAQTPVET